MTDVQQTTEAEAWEWRCPECGNTWRALDTEGERFCMECGSDEITLHTVGSSDE